MSATRETSTTIARLVYIRRFWLEREYPPEDADVVSDVGFLFATVDSLLAENNRLRRACGEQTAQVKKWRNRAHALRRRRSQMLRRLGLAISEDDSKVGEGQ